MRFFIFIFATFSFVTFTEAKDFGVQGHSFTIAEENILKVIEQRLQKIDLNQLNQKMKERTNGYVERPKAVDGITKAKGSKIFYYDPTYTLPADVKDHTGKLIHTAGTKVNPLEHMSLTESLIFIDGDDEKQMQFALKARAEKAGKLKIILVKGAPLKLQKQHKVWIYFDQQGVITKQLGITHVPALVEQEGLKLKISIAEVDKL